MGFKCLDISQCQIGKEGALVIAMMSVANWRINTVRFEGNPSTPDALQAQIQDVQKHGAKRVKPKISTKIKLKKRLTQRLKYNVRE